MITRSQALRPWATNAALATTLAACVLSARAQPQTHAPIDWGQGTGGLAAPASVTPSPAVVVPAPVLPPAAVTGAGKGPPAAPAAVAARPATSATTPLAPRSDATSATTTYRLVEVLRMPDAQMLQGIDGRPISAGEVKKRYAQQLRSRMAATARTAQLQRIVRPQASKVVQIRGVTKAPGAALKTADEALLAEVRALGGTPVDEAASVMHVDSGAVVKTPPSLPPPAGALATQGRSALPSVGVAADRATTQRTEPVTSAPSRVSCSKRQFAFANGATRYLSSVNKRAKDFWVDLDAGERTLVLSGCFEPGGAGRQPPPGGAVRIEGNFPLGHVDAKVRVWEETLIVAEVPMLSGVFDQDIAVRVVLGNRGTTNERRGHLWAKRESRALDDLSAYTTSGDCIAGVVGATWVVGKNIELEAGARGRTLGVGDVFYSGNCSESTPRGAKGRMHFQTHLAPGWQAVDLNLDVRRGWAHHTWEGAGDFDIRWTSEVFEMTDQYFGIVTDRWTAYAFHFIVGPLRLEGPAGTSPFARNGKP